MSETKGSKATAAIDYCLKTSYTKCITISEEDVRVYELMTNVLILNWFWAVFCCVLNVVIAGTGTILMAVLGDSNINKTQFVIGVLQFLVMLTTIVMLGIFGVAKIGGFTIFAWIWSVYWGALILMKSFYASKENQRILPGSHTRSD